MDSTQTEEGRVCRKCGEFKPSEAFNRNGRFPDGRVRLRAICRDCGSRRKLVETAPEKRCADCGEVKPTSEFRRNGINPYCNPCHNERVYAHMRGNGRPKHAAASVRWYRKKWQGDPAFREKTKAWGAVRRALVKEELQRPETCEDCGREGVRLNAHHHKGYAKAHWLDVRWLCARCHRKAEG